MKNVEIEGENMQNACESSVVGSEAMALGEQESGSGKSNCFPLTLMFFSFFSTK